MKITLKSVHDMHDSHAKDLLKELLIGLYRADELRLERGVVGYWSKIYHDDVEFDPVYGTLQPLYKAAYNLYKELNES